MAELGNINFGNEHVFFPETTKAAKLKHFHRGHRISYLLLITDNMRKNKSNLPLLNGDQVSIASSFYDNLPFEGLQCPPKQVKQIDYL